MRWLLMTLLSFLACCGPDHDSLAGKYDARQTAENTPQVRLELMDDGAGSWSMQGGAVVNFTWSQENSKVVLRTKNGGFVAGQQQGDAIILQLPGVQRLTFVPARD